MRIVTSTQQYPSVHFGPNSRAVTVIGKLSLKFSSRFISVHSVVISPFISFIPFPFYRTPEPLIGLLGVGVEDVVIEYPAIHPHPAIGTRLLIHNALIDHN